MSNRVEEAIRVALEAHAGVTRLGPAPLPYVVHSVDVLRKVRLMAGVVDEDALCAAVLHDTLEDTALTSGEIESRFGGRVRDLVEELTRRRVPESETTDLTPEQIRWANSELLVREAARMSPDAQRIKLCDRLSNLSESIVTRDPGRVEAYKRETLRLLSAIPRHIAPAVWDELSGLASSV